MTATANMLVTSSRSCEDVARELRAHHAEEAHYCTLALVRLSRTPITRDEVVESLTIIGFTPAEANDALATEAIVASADGSLTLA